MTGRPYYHKSRGSAGSNVTGAVSLYNPQQLILTMFVISCYLTMFVTAQKLSSSELRQGRLISSTKLVFRTLSEHHPTYSPAGCTALQKYRSVRTVLARVRKSPRTSVLNADRAILSLGLVKDVSCLRPPILGRQ
ncbi:hypothetical protein M3J09_001435 [Ascochyta lentis]